MKDVLIQRLAIIEKAFIDAQQVLGQANADLNMLSGCRQELMNLIQMISKECVEEPSFPIPADTNVNDGA